MADQTTTQSAPDRNLALELVRVTEAAAIAAGHWVGAGDKNSADGAAVDAMRSFLSTVDFNGTVVIGEGEKDEAPMLFNGEQVGEGTGPASDIAVDPIDGTRLTALGMNNALSVIAVADGVVANRYSGSPVWRPGISKQIINSIGQAPQETGIIPTAGVAVGRNQFLNFMSIRNWDSPGSWSTNFSAIATSTDNGETWGVYPGTIRPPGGGNENFQMGAFLKPGPGDPYLYAFGTPPGRGGAAYLARVAPTLVPDLTRYEYWNGDQQAWVPANPAAATPVIPGPVGELSAQYNTYLKQYVVLHCNGANDVVMRTAPAPQGPWGPEQTLVRATDIPGGIYAPYLHPWSVGNELYYTLSLWSAYNVLLLKTVLP